MLVYVLNKHGKPLMPCKPSKDGTVIHRSANCKDLKFISKAKTLLWERRIDVAVSSHD